MNFCCSNLWQNVKHEQAIGNVPMERSHAATKRGNRSENEQFYVS